VGTGALGSLFGGLLTEAGHDTLLLGRYGQISELQNLRIKTMNNERNVAVRTTRDPMMLADSELLLFTMKSYSVDDAIRQLPAELFDDCIILALQNGIGHLERMRNVIQNGIILAGVTYQAATLIQTGYVIHAAVGPTVLGPLDTGGRVAAESAAEALTAGGVSSKVADDINRELWIKLLINAAINPLAAITGMKNGDLVNDPEVMNMMWAVIKEGSSVCEKLGIHIGREDVFQRVIEVAETTAGNSSSMLQDVTKGQKTEIEAINGVIVENGRRLGVETPVNEKLLSRVVSLTKFRVDD